MSNWTHVAGIIRVDSIGDSDLLNKIKDIIGKEIHYGSSDKDWDDFSNHPEKYLPCGSEGSLHSTIWENPKKYCMAAYTVSIFGDLRDDDSATEIIRWFRTKTLVLDCISGGVRNACVVADNECFGMANWTYNANATKTLFGDDLEVATLTTDRFGNTVCFEDGTTMDFDDYYGAMIELNNRGYCLTQFV